MTTSHRPYDRPPAQMTPDGFCEIRASAVGDCQRRLFYSAGNVPKTDEVPEPAQRVMDYGNLLERQVLRMLEDCGWLLGNDGKPVELEVPVSDRVTIAGHVDAVAHNSDYNEGRLTLLEIKTRGNRRFHDIYSRGSWYTNPQAVKQLSIYRTGLIQEGWIAEEDDCCIVNFNRDNAALHIETFKASHLQEIYNQIQGMMLELPKHWNAGLPEPEYPVNDFHCLSCEWRTRCGNIRNISEKLTANTSVTLEAIREKLLLWESAKFVLDGVQEDFHGLDEELRSMTLEYMRAHGMTNLKLGGSVDWSVSLTERVSETLNKEKVRYLLTPLQYEESLKVTHSKPYVTFRAIKGE